MLLLVIEICGDNLPLHGHARGATVVVGCGYEWIGNAAVSRLGIDVPLVQAPIGSASTPELVAAVSNAGGLGMLALTWTGPERARRRIRRVRELTNRPFGVNLVLDFPIDDQSGRLPAGGSPGCVDVVGRPDPGPQAHS